MISRRLFMFALGTGAVTAPRGLLAQAQPAAGAHRIGFLAARSRSTAVNPDIYYDAFVQEMNRLGYIEGKNLVIEWRFADGKYERLARLAIELVRSNVEVIVTHALPPTRAAQQATNTIPIVFASMVDPVANRVVASLARPGGNVTGFSLMGTDVSPKRLEVLSILVPGISRVAFLANPLTSAHAAMIRSTEKAGEAIGVRVLTLEAQEPEQIDRAFTHMIKENANALIVPDDTFFLGQHRQIVGLALKHRMPALYPYAEIVEAGGLLSYGQDLPEFYRKTAHYVDRILKGVKPADLPVEQPIKFQVVINMKTARAIGLAIPQTMLLRADRVIE